MVSSPCLEIKGTFSRDFTNMQANQLWQEMTSSKRLCTKSLMGASTPAFAISRHRITGVLRPILRPNGNLQQTQSQTKLIQGKQVYTPYICVQIYSIFRFDCLMSCCVYDLSCSAQNSPPRPLQKNLQETRNGIASDKSITQEEVLKM